MRKQSLLIVIVLVACAFVLAGFQPKKNDAKFATLNNLKQVALASLMYMGDNDDVLPGAQTTATARVVLMPYAKNSSIFRSENPAKTPFEFNLALAGVKSSDITKPANTVLFYEPKPWPDGSRGVAFADGHCRLDTPSQWKLDSATLKRKYKRTAKLLPKNHLLQYDPLRATRR